MSQQRFCNTVEAKAKLNELLGEVTQGREVIIRRRGRAVAKLVQVSEETLDESQEINAFMGRLRKFHRRIRNVHGRKSRTVDLLREIRRES